ncbi:MAG TPA: alpha/beta hydrolase [Acidimicrobiia bacterium]|nr:alpha/beta hydrolase [Acidimicrobiia bacterium]
MPTPRARHSRDIPPGRFVDVDGPVHYREWPGPDDLTIVCVHALGRNHLSWIGPAPALAKHGRVLAFDMPGYGLTPRDGRRGTVPAQQQTLNGFLDATTHGPVVLVGESLGGAVSARQAGQDPDRVAGVALVSAYMPPVFGGWRAPAVVSGLLLERLGELGRILVDIPLDRIVPRVGRVPLSDEVRRLAAEMQREEPRTLLSNVTDAEALASLVTMSALTSRAHEMFDAIRCPVLILHGEVDAEVPAVWARAAAADHPDWELHVIREVGHICDLDDPGLWASIATRWIEQTVKPRARREA